MKADALTDMLEILTAGGRLNPEKSRALPSGAYGDPAKSIEFAGEIERKRKLKAQRQAEQATYRTKGK